MNWQRHEACDRVAATAREAQDLGYLLAIYGSTLRGEGRDLDLLAVPWRDGAEPSSLLALLCRKFAAEEVGQAYRGRMGTTSAILQMRDGKLIDVQIRDAPIVGPTMGSRLSG